MSNLTFPPPNCSVGLYDKQRREYLAPGPSLLSSYQLELIEKSDDPTRMRRSIEETIVREYYKQRDLQKLAAATGPIPWQKIIAVTEELIQVLRLHGVTASSTVNKAIELRLLMLYRCVNVLVQNDDFARYERRQSVYDSLNNIFRSSAAINLKKLPKVSSVNVADASALADRLTAWAADVQAMVDAITGQESDGPQEAAVASETATPSTPSPASWPPDGGWHTGPGAVWFRGAQYKITPIVRRLLEAILTSGRETLLKTELIDVGWEGDEYVADHAFTKQISKLRATLREIAAAQGLDIEDPLKQYDGGYTFMMPRK